MTQIHILDNEYPGRLKPVPPFWHAVHINRRIFHDADIRFRYFKQDAPGLCDCDLLFVSSRVFRVESKTGADKESALRTLASYADQCPIVWFDMRDSTGNTQFEVLPYVRAYWKKQVLKDRSQYRTMHYGNRMYTHFFHLRFGIEDDYEEECFLLPKELEHRLDISWNLGMQDNRPGGPIDRIVNVASDWFSTAFGIQTGIPHRLYGLPRTNNMLALFNTEYDRKTVSHQRKEALKILQTMNAEGIVFGQKVSRTKYHHLLYHSKIVLSLFGWGELCHRDYEAFLAGGALLMPDVSHLETWPDFYAAKETYWPLQWDLSDLKEAYYHLVQHEELRSKIARQGQERYLQAWGEAGRERFCERLIQRIRLLLSNT